MEALRWALVAVLIQASLFGASAQEATGVASQLALGNVKVVIKASDGASVQTVSGAYPKVLLSNPQVPASAALEVTTTVSKDGASFKPQQVMLMLKSKSLGVAAYAVGKLKSGSYVTNVNVAAIEKQIGKAPGEYEVSLVVGDPAVPAGINYALGTAEFLVSASSSAPQPAAAVRTAAFQPVNNIKPEIQHIFRAPEKRPPVVVSYAFAVLALVPLAAVVLYVPAFTGVNLKGWSTAPLYSMLFHGGIAGMLLLYLLFWLRLNLAQTLPLAALGGLFVAGSGYLLLSALATQRLKKD